MMRGSSKLLITDGVSSSEESSTTIHSNETDSSRMLRHTRDSKWARLNVGVMIETIGEFIGLNAVNLSRQIQGLIVRVAPAPLYVFWSISRVCA